MTVLSYIQLGIEVMAFITSMIFYKALALHKWLLWIPFLLYTCIVEIWGTYIQVVTPKLNNMWLYNPYIIVSLAFYGWFLIQSAVLKPKTKTVLYFLLFMISLGSIIWYIEWGPTQDLIKYVLNIGALIICSLCLLFFYALIKNPFGFRSLTDVPAFWMVAGILVFYSGISIYMTIYDTLAEKKIRLLGATLQNLIPQVLSLVLYSTIIVAFMKCRTMRSLSRSL